MKDDRHFCDAPLSPARQVWLMLLVIAPMAACYPAIKTGLDFAPSLRFGGLRTLVGGLALLLVLVIRREPLWPEARLARWILPLGLVATTLTFGAMFASPAYTGAGIASVLGNTQPLIIIVLAALFLSERIGWCKGLALGLGLAGVTLLALPALREQSGHPLLGAILALGASASAAVATVIVKRLRPGKDLTALTGWQLIVGSIVLLGLSAVFEPRETIAWTGGFVGLLLFLALAGTAMSTWLWFWLLQRSEAGRLSLYLFLVPVFGLLIAISGFGERLNALQGGGVAFILMAVAFSVFAGRSGPGRRSNQAGREPSIKPQRPENHRSRMR
ncbi:MAG TPA: DMT family transporter [Clostridia bacterium]|nr:DMT family transporter [Clostridia bacterium]